VWEEDTEDGLSAKLAEVRRHLVIYAACFGVLFAGVLFVFWWSRTAVDFSAARVTGSNAPTYRVTGVVSDAHTGKPIPWARIQDDPGGMPPLFEADGGIDGAYSLLTLPLVHNVIFSAQGYRPRALEVGRSWYQWWPRGEQQLNVQLVPDP
jgi:hypothetical protein